MADRSFGFPLDTAPDVPYSRGMVSNETPIAKSPKSPEAVKLASALRRIRKIQSEIASGSERPAELLPSLTRAFDAAYKWARFVSVEAGDEVQALGKLTAGIVETGQEMYRMRLSAQADYATGQAQLQRKRIDPDSWKGELELVRIGSVK